jgi:hypothetical protein
MLGFLCRPLLGFLDWIISGCLMTMCIRVTNLISTVCMRSRLSRTSHCYVAHFQKLWLKLKRCWNQSRMPSQTSTQQNKMISTRVPRRPTPLRNVLPSSWVACKSRRLGGPALTQERELTQEQKCRREANNMRQSRPSGTTLVRRILTV